MLVKLVCFLSLLNFGHLEEDELILANVLYRHGARSPIQFYKTNPIQVDDWPDGPGRLTQVGMRMEYDLGNFLRDRYVNNRQLINQSFYLHKQVYIRSSSIDRCLQSAQSQLAALYPPKDFQVWKKDLLWQPIPIQTVPGPEDVLLRPAGVNCPRIQEIWNEMANRVEFQNMGNKKKELLDYMTEKSGQKITLQSMWAVTDDILCEQAEGKKSSKWAMNNFTEILNLTYWAANYMYQGSDELGRLLGGSLLGEMVKNMNAKKDGSKDIPNLYMYSGHDTSIMAFSTALNVRLPVPNFAACVLVELHKTKENRYYVTIDYKNGNDTSMFKLTGCEYKCSLDDFIRITKSRIPTNRKKECNGPPEFFTKKRLQVVSAVLFALAIFFFIVILWMCFRKHCRRSFINQKSKSINKIPNEYEDHEQANLIT